MSLESVYLEIISLVERFLSSKNWKIKTVLFSIVFFILSQAILAPASFLYHIEFIKHYFLYHQEYESYKIINERTDDLFGIFKSNTLESNSHEHKLIFRLLLPLIAMLSPFKQVGLFIYVLQFAIGIYFTYLVCGFVFDITKEKVTTFFFVLTFTSIYAGNAYIWDVVGYGDFFAYFFLFLSIYSRNILYVFIPLSLAFWVDERAVVNASFVYCWWLIANDGKEIENKLFNIKYLVLIGSAIIGYLAIRVFLMNYYELPKDNQYSVEFRSTIYENIKYQGFRLWSGFEGFVGLISLVYLALFLNKKYKVLFLLLLASIASITVAFFAHDGNRGFSFSLILIFICLSIASRYFTKKELLYLMISIFIISLLFPMANRLRFPNGYTIM